MRIFRHGFKWLPIAIFTAVLFCTTVDFDDLDDGVIDSIPPVITIDGKKLQTIDVNTAYEPVTVTAYDSVDGDLTAKISELGSIDTSVVGTHKIWYTVSDLSLNTSNDSLVIIVINPSSDDSIDPVLTIPGDNPDTITVGDTWTNPTAVASDNIDGNISANVQITGEVNSSQVGTYNLIYSITDAAGNTTTDTLVVVVKNDSSIKQPKLELKGEDSIVVAMGDLFTEPGFIVIDTLGDTAIESVAKALVKRTFYDSANTVLTAADTSLGSKEGLFKIKYVLDYMGSTIIKWRQIRVTNDDLTPPVITILGDNPDTVWSTAASAYISIDTGANAGAIAIDNGTDTLTVNKADSVNMLSAGSYKFYYSATDANGNTADTFRVVVVLIDDEDPTISISKNVDTIDVGDEWDSVTVTATDNADGDISAAVTASGSVDNSKKGINKIVYSVSDVAGNSTTDTVTVYVFDLPTITLLGDNPDTVILGAASYIDDSAKVVDNISDTFNVGGTGIGDLNFNVAGRDTITYFYVDTDGNATDTLIRVIDIYDMPDTVDPVITINGDNPDTIWVGETYVEAGATAIDEKDGDLTASIDTNSQVNNAAAGSYNVVYTVSDAAGNSDTATRVVVVKADTEKPVITISGSNPDTIWINESYAIPEATASDNKDASVTVTHTGTVNADSAATYTIIYSATDAAGNNATKDLIVVVKGVGNELIIEDFETGEKGQIKDETGNNGWWYGVSNDSTKSTVTPGSLNNFDIKVQDSASFGTGKGLYAELKLEGDNYPYASIAFSLKASDQYYNLSGVNRITLMMKGSGTIRIALATEYVNGLGINDAWGHFGVDVTLTSDWKKIIINKDDILPNPDNSAITKTWSEVSNKVTSMEFALEGEQIENGSTVTKIYMDDIKFYGISAINP